MGIAATAASSLAIRRLEDNRLSIEFERRALARVAAVRDGLERAVADLQVVNRYFTTSENVSREEFQAFARPLLERGPHIRNFAFHRMIAGGERQRFENEMRKRHPDFTLTEIANGARVPAATRRSYRVVDYLEPEPGNEAALGLDLSTRHEQDAAARRACGTGQPSSTGMYRLVQHSDSQRGFVMLMPVYRADVAFADPAVRCSALIGYTAAVFDGKALVERTLAARRIQGTPEFDVAVYTGAAGRHELVFRDVGAADQSDAAAENLARTFDLAGRSWRVEVTARHQPPFIAHLASLLTMFGGTLFSLLAAAYIRMLVSGSQRVRQQVAERTAELQKLNETLQVRQEAIESCSNVIAITSAAGPDYPIEYVNPAFERVTGYSAAEMIGRSCDLLWAEDAEQAGVRDIHAGVRARRAVDSVIRTYRKDGSPYWSNVHVAPVKNASGEIHHFVVAHYDITEIKRYEAELEYHVNHDMLTGLANRNLFRERLSHAINRAARNQRSLWVLFIDIDRFKRLIDSLGYRAGDMLLTVTAQRLQAAVCETDTVARLGGDEFTLILEEKENAPLSAHAVQRIMNLLSQPIALEGSEYFPSYSVGIASYPQDGEDAGTLKNNAHFAMCSAREAGRNNFQFYTRGMNEVSVKKLALENALRCALEREEFVLHYQPQVDLGSGRVVGVEALIRWQHPENGMVAPDAFITLAEETGLIVPIGAWVLRTACAQAKAWESAGLGPLRVAINLSACQFAQQDVVSMIATALDDTGLAADRLDIELTESLVMQDVEHAIGVLNALRHLGVQLSIDDFGTGYSSLSYLKRFPIDVLKIDRSFVREIPSDANDAAISDAIISMAHSLGIRVIAEGVETEAQCEFLARNMCDEIQGFLFSVPLPADGLEALLRDGRCLPQHLLRLHKPPRTLLLVDDEPSILSALKRQLRGKGYQILTAASGIDGLALLARNEVDVIVSDQRMPGMTGVEFLRTVKTLYPDTVRIVLSGFTELQTVTDAVNEGAIYKFLTKPWEDDQLLEHIEEAFSHKEMANENRRLNLEIRAANQELARANRQLEDVLAQQKRQIRRGEVSLDIVREVLQHIPLPVIGLDDDEVVVLANGAAQELFAGTAPLLGNEAGNVIPEILQAVRGMSEGEKWAVKVGQRSVEVIMRSMGHGTQSRGKLITVLDAGNHGLA